MDDQTFDTLTRGIGRAANRRTMLGALLTSLTVPLLPTAADARRGGKARKRGGKAKSRHRQGGRLQTQAACYNGSPCIPGPGKNLSKCDFSDSPALENKNVKGSNLGSANLTDADASGVNIQAANLGKACLVGADLTGAKINNSTNLGGAIFCRTVMPDGSENNAGCGLGTACCPTCDADRPCDDGEVCCNNRCVPGDCCDNDDCASDEQCCGLSCISRLACCIDGDEGCPAGERCCSLIDDFVGCFACCLNNEICSSADECCTDVGYDCIGGHCCLPNTSPCADDIECCSGRCRIPQGMTDPVCIPGV